MMKRGLYPERFVQSDFNDFSISYEMKANCDSMRFYFRILYYLLELCQLKILSILFMYRTER